MEGWQRRDRRDAFWRLLAFFGPYWRRLLICIAFIGAAEGLRLYFIWLTQHLLRPLIEKGVTEGELDQTIRIVHGWGKTLFQEADARLLLLGAVCMVGLVIAFFRAILTFASTFLANNIAQKTAMDIRRHLFAHLQLMSPGFFNQENSGRLLARVINDVAALQQLVTIGIGDLIATPLLIVGSFALMLLLSFPLTLIALALLPPIGWLLWKFGHRLREASRQAQAATADLTAVLKESLGAIKLVQAAGAERQSMEAFERRNRRLYRNILRIVRLSAMLLPTVELIGTVGVIVGVFIGGWFVIRGWMTPESLLAFMVYFYTLATNLRRLARIQGVREQVAGAAERLFQVLDTPPDITDAPDAEDLTEVKGHIVFEDVSFRYPNGTEVLRDVSFEIRPGEKVALVGLSGVGKTTLALLLARFYDPQKGRILLDGKDLRKIRVSSLRRHIGLVLQDTFVVEGTVRDNIALGKPDATDEEIVTAAKSANAHEFIERLPNGYEAWVGESGSLLSVGQRQRIALARAFLKRPSVLVLDEMAAHLDAESEASIQEALKRVMEDKTVLFIAHRISTVQNADRILVLQDGRIVAEGTHKELMAKSSLYRRLYGLQMEGARGR